MARLLTLILILTFAVIGEPQNLKYCIQVAADKDFERVKTFYERIKDFPEARIENRDGVYLLRVGAEDDKKDLAVMLRRVKSYFPDAFVKKCEIRKDLVVFPKEKVVKPDTEKSQNTKKVKQEEAKPVQIVKIQKEAENISQLKSTIKDLKEEVEKLREEISRLKKNLKDAPRKDNTPTIKPADLEKFLFSVGIFTTGMFLLTWILILLIYRKVGHTNIQNTNLLNDLLRLVKILHLLGKGETVKMENGKIYIYDKKSESWREVE